MKVVVTDYLFPDLQIEEDIIKAAGAEFAPFNCKTEEELIAAVGDADAVITQFAKVNANVIGAMKKARVIVRYGIGVDNVDLEAAKAQGIAVCNIPEYCIDEVADQALSFILALTRQVVGHTLLLREGKWALYGPVSGMQALRDLTVGVIGAGRIGREVVKRLIPFKCKVLVFDPVTPAADIQALGATSVSSTEELFGQSNVITLHCPSNAKTRKMVNAESLAKLPAGALVINVGRGDLVDTDALVAALQSGHLGGAGLDVFDPEPLPVDHPLRSLPNVVIAPHIASVSPKAVVTLRSTVAESAATSLTGSLPPNVVNGITTARA